MKNTLKNSLKTLLMATLLGSGGVAQAEIIIVQAVADGGNGACSTVNTCQEYGYCYEYRPSGTDYQKITCPSGYQLVSHASGSNGQSNGSSVRITRGFSCGSSRQAWIAKKTPSALTKGLCARTCQ